MTINSVSCLPGEGMSYDASQLHQSTPRPGLLLLCLLVKGRNGQARSLPVHTLRPMPPRVCPTGQNTKNGPNRWDLDALGLPMGDHPGLYLRQTHAKRPTGQILERCGKHRQARAIRAATRTLPTGGVTA
jgi:hypothetical protein